MKFKDFINNWILHQFIIYGVSIIVGIIVGLRLTFSHESLFWVASTVIQAFGALIAIILAVGIHQIKSVMTLRKQKLDGLYKYFEVITSKLEPESMDVGLKEYHKIKEEAEEEVYNVFKELGGTIQSIALLIGWAIIILILAEPIGQYSIYKPQSGNIIISMALVYLGISSFYCLQKLINRIRDVLARLNI
jgi:hypothetical protein